MFDYDKFFTDHPLDIHNQPERHDKIASLCSGNVLDIGCGTGSLSEYFKGDYTGYDISKVAIKQATEHRRKDAIFNVGDFLTFNGFDFEPYDTIVMSEFLEHIADDKIIIDSIKKTAKHNTRIIISVPNYKKIPSPDHVRIFTVAGLKKKFSELGNITFYNWQGECERIIMTVDFGVPQKKVLSLGIIAKDEEKGIEHAILSSLGVVDDVVVLIDSRTKDKTEKIARRYTENTFLYVWQEDFSAARNNLLEKIRTPWILFLDGHEYLKRATSLENLQDLEEDALMCEIRLESNSIVRYPRLHKSNLKYKDKVHNLLVCSKIGNYNNILIVHDRVKSQSVESVAEREKQRDKMVIGIMSKQLKENKKNVRASLHLGLHYHARRKFKKAIKYYKKYLRYSTFPGERWYIRFNLALCYSKLLRHVRAEYQTVLMEKESPNRWETKFSRGLYLMDQKKYSEAVVYLVESLDVVKQESGYKPLVKNYGVIWNNIGECFFNTAKYFQAGEAFLQAAESTEDLKFKSLLGRRSDLMYKMAKN